MSSTISTTFDDPISFNLSSISSTNDGIVAAASTAVKRSTGGLEGVEGFEGNFTFLDGSAFGDSSGSSSVESSFAGSPPAHFGIFSDPLIASSNDNAVSESTNENTIDLEKQQQHHLRQFLYYQNLAIQRQEAVTRLAQQHQTNNLLASDAFVPSLSPSPSTPLPPPPRPSSSPEDACLRNALDPMQDYPYNLGRNTSNSTTKMDSTFASGGGQSTAGQSTNGYAQRAPQAYHQMLSSASARLSVSGYSSSQPTMDGNVMYNGYASPIGGRQSYDGGVPINQGHQMQRNNSVGHIPQSGFASAGMQMSFSNSSAQDVGLVKGPYMVPNGGGGSFYAPTPAGSEASYQAQQAQLHQAVTNAAFDMAAMYQPMQQQQYQTSYSHQPTSSSTTAAPYAAQDLSVPSYYRIHSSDPAIAQATASGAVKMESVSPCPSIPGPIKSNEVDELEGSAASFTMKKRESNTSSGASKASALGSSDPNSADQSVNGEIDISKVVLNPLGGGRGYVPGETPDDPKKRHKCEVCGRGFARLFNLKSHHQTHDPMRLKPHICPHEPCSRSFSRLHDLERHRQGVHFDGPLMVAKRQGISPSIARAQSRLAKRAERGALV